MAQLLARPEYYRIVLELHYGRDFGILNRYTGNAFEDEVTSAGAHEDECELKYLIEELILTLNESKRRQKAVMKISWWVRNSLM